VCHVLMLPASQVSHQLQDALRLIGGCPLYRFTSALIKSGPVCVQADEDWSWPSLAVSTDIASLEG
jgi:hypothetical protein